MVAAMGQVAAAAAAEPIVSASRSGLPWPSGVFTSTPTTRAMEAWRGRPFDVETLFFGTLTWQHMISSAGVLKSKMPGLPSRLIVALGMVPVDHVGRLEECAAGQFDPFIRALTSAMLANGAAAASAAGKPVLIRLGWEANAVESGYPWMATGDGTSWRDCFRRWVDILNPITDAAATPPARTKNFLIVWNMANRGSFKHPIDNMWPGEDYVDVVASQFYDRCPPLPEGNQTEWARRLLLRDAHGNPAGPLAWLDYARAKGKPYAMPEWGIGGPNDVCGRPGTDNAHFMARMYGFFQTIAPDLAFESYFNGHGFINDSKGTHKLFALDPAFPDPASPDYLAYVQRYNPQSATTYRTLWGQDLATVPPEISVMPLAASAAEDQEGPTPFTFTVTRTGNPSLAVAAAWRVAGGSANAADFVGGVLPSGTVSLAAGETSKTLTVAVQGDLQEEADESFSLTLSDPTGGASIGAGTASGEILNDDLEPALLAVLAASAARNEGHDGTTPFTFTVTRSGGTRRPVSVDWQVTGDSADLADFAGGVLPSGRLNFGAGQTKKTITVQVQGDTTVEPHEVFSVTLLDPTGDGVLATATATGTIRNDDAEPPVLAIAAAAAAKAEGQSGTTPFTFTVTRSGDGRPAVSAAWQVAGGSADAADFTGGVLPSGTVSLAAWQTSKTVTVTVRGDRTVEPDEVFHVVLANPTGGASIGTGSATATILNDDVAPPTLHVATLVVAADEGHSGTTPITFRVTRAGDASRAVSIGWQVANVGTDALDFAGGVLPSGTLSLGAGETAGTFTVQVQGDVEFESDEAFEVHLAQPTGGALIGTAAATATIRNDDTVEPATLAVAALDAVKAEGHGGPFPFTFTVTRSGDSRGGVGAAWQVTANGADADDFVGAALPSGSVWFKPGETRKTLWVQVQGDRLVEADESFAVVLSAPRNGVAIGTATAQGTILNDDVSPPVLNLAALAGTVDEGQGGTTPVTFSVTRTGDVGRAVGVAWQVVHAGTDVRDFAGGVLPSGTVSLAAEATTGTFTVQVQGDTELEGDENFEVHLSRPTGGALLGTATASVTIRNDDAVAPATLDVAAVDAVKPEGSGRQTAFAFIINRSGDSRGGVGAAWQVTASSADAGDFVGAVLPSGSVWFRPGETRKTLWLQVQGDRLVEPDESFSLTLSAPRNGAAIGVGTAIGTILNDDAAPVTLAVTPLSATKAEGNRGTTPFTFAVTRAGDTRQAVRVGWTVLGSGKQRATADDFIGQRLPSGTLLFAAGETRKVVTVAVAGDTRRENAEGFSVSLSNLPAGARLTQSAAYGTIVNDDR